MFVYLRGAGFEKLILRVLIYLPKTSRGEQSLQKLILAKIFRNHQFAKNRFIFFPLSYLWNFIQVKGSCNLLWRKLMCKSKINFQSYKNGRWKDEKMEAMEATAIWNFHHVFNRRQVYILPSVLQQNLIFTLWITSVLTLAAN